MVTACATANITEGYSRSSRESGLLCSHSHGESIGLQPKRQGMEVREQLAVAVHRVAAAEELRRYIDTI